MAKVGDSVSVTLRGIPGGDGMRLSGGLHILPGEKIQVLGDIVYDLGDFWLVKLGMEIGGNDQLTVPKATERRSPHGSR